MKQIGIKIIAESYRGVEFIRLERKKKKKMATVHISAHLGSVCRRRFRRVTVAVPGVKSLVEDHLEG